MQIPQDQNPANDPTGAHCTINQTDKNVWFTTGTLSGSAERTCKIPAGKDYLPGRWHRVFHNREPRSENRCSLKKCAADAMQTFRDPASLQATLDGVPLKNLSQYRVKSDAFDVNFPAHNIWGVKRWPTSPAADTYFIFLKPLSSGKHVFTFQEVLQLFHLLHLSPIPSLLTLSNKI